MKLSEIIALILVLVIIAGVIYYIEGIKPLSLSGISDKTVNINIANDRQEQKAKKYPVAREIVDEAGFINTDPITIQSLVGKKVILVDFWTYSCINCIRTLPYLNAWYEKYKDQGLEIIGVHSPEFEFEKVYDNVKAAVEKYNIKYPVVLDNNKGTWQNYRNLYWPRDFLIDADGFIVYDHIGEGGYAETEKEIQQLLTERLTILGQKGEISTGLVAPTGAETVSSQTLSPETYFGANRNDYLSNGRSGTTGLQKFTQPTDIKTNNLYLVGGWNIQGEYAQSASAGAKIIFRYQAQKVFIVAHADTATKIDILLDGKPLDQSAGSDVSQSQAIIKEDRLYRLIEAKSYGEHTLEIIIEQPGLKVYTFTFG